MKDSRGDAEKDEPVGGIEGGDAGGEKCVHACVCVCEREREREKEEILLLFFP